MNASALLELASLVAAHGPVLIEGPGRLSPSGMEHYWTASQCRFDRWARAFKRWTLDAADLSTGEPTRNWPTFRATMEEVLAGEVLTRVFGAVVTAHDARHQVEQASPIVKSVFLGHLEARNRVLRCLVGGPDIPGEEAFRLNRLRRRAERWIDMLVGYLNELVDVDQFANDPQRARDFAEDLSFRRRLAGGQCAWALIQAALHTTFGVGLSPTSPNADLNRQIGESVLSCFRSELFESTGTLRSLWLTRLHNGANDVHVMIDDLLGDEVSAFDGASDVSDEHFLDRLRRFNRS